MKKILVDGFLSKMKTHELDLWRIKHGKSVNESLKQFLIEYVGEPIQRALRWVSKWFKDLNFMYDPPLGESSCNKGLGRREKPWERGWCRVRANILVARKLGREQKGGRSGEEEGFYPLPLLFRFCFLSNFGATRIYTWVRHIVLRSHGNACYAGYWLINVVR